MQIGRWRGPIHAIVSCTEPVETGFIHEDALICVFERAWPGTIRSGPVITATAIGRGIPLFVAPPGVRVGPAPAIPQRIARKLRVGIVAAAIIIPVLVAIVRVAPRPTVILAVVITPVAPAGAFVVWIGMMPAATGRIIMAAPVILWTTEVGSGLQPWAGSAGRAISFMDDGRLERGIRCLCIGPAGRRDQTGENEFDKHVCGLLHMTNFALCPEEMMILIE